MEYMVCKIKIFISQYVNHSDTNHWVVCGSEANSYYNEYKNSKAASSYDQMTLYTYAANNNYDNVVHTHTHTFKKYKSKNKSERKNKIQNNKYKKHEFIRKIFIRNWKLNLVQ